MATKEKGQSVGSSQSDCPFSINYKLLTINYKLLTINYSQSFHSYLSSRLFRLSLPRNKDTHL